MKLFIAAVAALSALPATAVSTGALPAASRIAKAVVKASATAVTEGDRVRLTVKVPQARDAKRVVLQERYVSVRLRRNEHPRVGGPGHTRSQLHEVPCGA